MRPSEVNLRSSLLLTVSVQPGEDQWEGSRNIGDNNQQQSPAGGGLFFYSPKLLY